MSHRFTKIIGATRVLFHWARRRSEVLPYLPQEISIETTNRCNFKCAFCPQSKTDHFAKVPAATTSPSQIKRILERLRAAGVKTDTLHWTLDGEPFMDLRFHEHLFAARDHGFNKAHFATNGMLLTRERLHALPREGVKVVMTTDFCADEQYFEEVRGTPGSWRTVLENIRAALEDEALAHLSFEITDISSFKVQAPRALTRRFKALKALFPRSDRVSFHQRGFHNAAGTMGQASKEPRYRLCPYPWFALSIAHNGDVVACCRDLEHQTVLGNLFEEGLLEIWNGERYRTLRRDLMAGHPERQAACAGCDMPYDGSKFTAKNFAKTALYRMNLLDR